MTSPPAVDLPSAHGNSGWPRAITPRNQASADGGPAYVAITWSTVGNVGRTWPAADGISPRSSCPTSRYGSRTFWYEREIS